MMLSCSRTRGERVDARAHRRDPEELEERLPAESALLEEVREPERATLVRHLPGLLARLHPDLARHGPSRKRRADEGDDEDHDHREPSEGDEDEPPRLVSEGR